MTKQVLQQALNILKHVAAEGCETDDTCGHCVACQAERTIEPLRDALEQQGEQSDELEFGMDVAAPAALAQQGEQQRGGAGGVGSFEKAMSCSGAVLNPFQGAGAAPAAQPVQQGEPVAWRSAVLDLIDDCPGLTMEQDRWLSRRVKELDFPSAPAAQPELPQKARPDFITGYDAGMADAKRMAQQGEPVAWEPIPDPDFTDFKAWQQLPSDDNYIYHRAPDMTWLRLRKPSGCYFPSAPAAQPVQGDSRVLECARRLVEHADFKLGGILSSDSKAKDIPSRAVSQVKSRHLAALRDAIAAAPAAQPVQLTDIPVALLERLRATLTRLGQATPCSVEAFGADIENQLYGLCRGIDSVLDRAAAPAAQPDARTVVQQGEPVAYTTGHCENHKQKGGCQLHNLQCGWPNCDRKSVGAAPAAQPSQAAMFDCDIQPRPLAHPLRDYHFAPSEGPLNYTWRDKPHRLLYDLIAAVRYYAAAPAAQPQDDRPEGALRIQMKRDGQWKDVTKMEEVVNTAEYRRGIRDACAQFAMHDGNTYADMVLEHFGLKEKGE